MLDELFDDDLPEEDDDWKDSLWKYLNPCERLFAAMMHYAFKENDLDYFMSKTFNEHCEHLNSDPMFIFGKVITRMGFE